MLGRVKETQPDAKLNQSRDGEIGKRSRLKICRPEGHAGSTPAPGTNTLLIDAISTSSYSIAACSVDQCIVVTRSGATTASNGRSESPRGD